MSWKKLTVAMAAMIALFIIGREINLTQLANHRMQQQIVQMQQQITELQKQNGQPTKHTTVAQLARLTMQEQQ